MHVIWITCFLTQWLLSAGIYMWKSSSEEKGGRREGAEGERREGEEGVRGEGEEGKEERF